MIRVAALLMAAGNARRMGGPNKLLLPFHGKPLLAYAAEAVAACRAIDKTGVTGRDAGDISLVLAKAGLSAIHNPRYDEGFGTSIAAGIEALSGLGGIDGVLIALGDMPDVTTAHLDQMIARFEAEGGGVVVRACCGAEPGNPVIVPASLFAGLAALNGDEGGRSLIAAGGLKVVPVDIGPAALADIDTPEAFANSQEAGR